MIHRIEIANAWEKPKPLEGHWQKHAIFENRRLWMPNAAQDGGIEHTISRQI
jgi:hypothetical protein